MVSDTVHAHPIAARVANRMRSLRGARQWSAERLAEEMSAMGVDWNRGIVSKLETGRRENVTVDELVALGSLLDVSPMELMGLDCGKVVTAEDSESARLIRAIAAKFGIVAAEGEPPRGVDWRAP